MKRILVTNDDGVRSEGLQALANALLPLGEVTIVPPRRGERHQPRPDAPAPAAPREDRRRVYAVDGTPTDCVNIGVITVLKGLPDLVVSGINKGWNLGDDVTYSGTVAGRWRARCWRAEHAVSLKRTNDEFDFTQAAEAAAKLAAACCVAGCHADVPQRERAVGEGEGLSRHHPGEAEPRDVGGGEDRPPRQPYYWIEEGANDWEPHEFRTTTP